MNGVVFRSDARDQLEHIGYADIVVGIPSFNNARTIGHVILAVQAGLEKYFPACKAVIVNSDGGSTDGTVDVVQNSSVQDYNAILLQHRAEPVSRVALSYAGIPGKGSAFRAIFEIADKLNAKACAVVDSDLRSITPEWMELLIKPVFEYEYDYVSPLYSRHKFDGTITNSIVYPLTRALYGKRVRQPIGGDFGFSGELARFYLSQNVWEGDVARFGIDIWMTTMAIANGFKVVQSFLGAKIHDAKDPGADLSDMLYQVVSVTFALMETCADAWIPVTGSEAVPAFGFQYTVGLEHVPVNTEGMLRLFRTGLANLKEIWLPVIGEADFAEVVKLGALSDGEFSFPIGLWTRIVYDFAIAFHQKRMSAEHLIKAMMPLYIGKTASFVIQAEHLTQHETEDEIEKLCVEFENNKQYLVATWKQ